MDNIETADTETSVAKVVAVELAKSVAIAAVGWACYYGSGVVAKKFKEFKESRKTTEDTPADN